MNNRVELLRAAMAGNYPPESPEGWDIAETCGAMKMIVLGLGDAQYINEMCVPMARAAGQEVEDYVPEIPLYAMPDAIACGYVIEVESGLYALTSDGMTIWGEDPNFNDRPNGWSSHPY